MASWLVSPVGLVLSIFGLGPASGRRGDGRGKAIAGIVLGLVGLAICSIYVAALSSAGSSAPIAATGAGTPSYTPPSGPLTSISSGTYDVGTGDGEVAPGKYVAPAGSSHCYYARLKNTDGDLDSINDNKLEVNGGQVILNVKNSDNALEVGGDCTFTEK